MQADERFGGESRDTRPNWGSATTGQRPIVPAMKRAVLRLGSLALLGLGLYGIWTVFRSGEVIALVLVMHDRRRGDLGGVEDQREAGGTTRRFGGRVRPVVR